MEDLISDKILDEISKGSILFFLFIRALLNNESFFLVYYASKLMLVELETEQMMGMIEFSKICLQNLFQDPLDVTWEIISNKFKLRYPEICVFIDGNLTVIPIISLFLGRRNLMVKTRLGDKIGKFMGFSQGIATNVSVLLRNINIVIDVPIENIIGLPTSEQLRKCDEEFEKAKIKSFEDHLLRRGELQEPPSPQKYYPLLSDHLLQILYHLSMRHNIEIGFNYIFNLLVFRLLSFGDQKKFKLPQLSEGEQVNFENFKRKYQNMCGKVICSEKARFQEPSGISEHLRRVFEYYRHLFEFESISDEDVRVFLQRTEGENARLALSMKTDVEALSLPASYWVQPEQGVVVKELKSEKMMLYHLLRDKEVFDALTQ